MSLMWVVLPHSTVGNEVIEAHVRFFNGAAGSTSFLWDGNASPQKDPNASPQKDPSVDDCLEEEDICCMDWLAKSLDLDPIEHVWDRRGRAIA